MEKDRLVEFVAKVMEESGFKVYKDYKTSKYIVDLYGVLNTVFGDIGVVVACKSYEDRWKVGMDVLKEMEMVTKTLQASKVVVVSTSYFSDNAIDYANRRNIKLIDKDGVIKLAKSFSKKDITEEESYEEIDDYEPPYIPPSSSTGGMGFINKGRRSLTSGNKRRRAANKLGPKIKWLLNSTIFLILLVIVLSSAIAYAIEGIKHVNTGILGVVKILFSAILSYGIVLSVNRNITAALVKGTIVFFVSLLVFVLMIIL